MIDEGQQDIQTNIVGGLHLLTHVTTDIRNWIHSLEPGSARRGEWGTDTDLSQELDEAFEHIITVGVTVVVDI